MSQHNKPILVTGSHRSGTTWVGRMIALHPSVKYIQEPFNIEYINPLFSYQFPFWFYYIRGGIEEKKILWAYKKTLIRLSNPLILGMKDYVNGDSRSLKTFTNLVNKHYALSVRILFKDPIALFSTEWLYKKINAQPICMIRNPVAFAGSLKKWDWQFDFNHFLQQKEMLSLLHPFQEKILAYSVVRPDIVKQATLLWNIFHYIISEYRKEHPEWLFIRYEDIAKSPIKYFQVIYEYLDLELTPDIKKAITMSSARDNSAEANTPAFKPRNAKDSLETWKTRLSPDEIRYIQNETKTIAQQFYTLQGNEYL